MKEQNSNIIYNYLKELFPEAKTELKYKNDYQLIVAVILSAQCTDKRVNMVTEKLFDNYATVYELANAILEDLEQVIRSCNFYKNKAKNLIKCAKTIVENFDGKVPSNISDLQTLACVGRKTANVVYSAGFGGQAIAVDTHVLRVSNRLALANSSDPLEVEKSLMKVYDESVWTEVHNMLVLFGRYYCTAKKPKCDECKLKNICKYYKQVKKEI